MDKWKIKQIIIYQCKVVYWVEKHIDKILPFLLFKCERESNSSRRGTGSYLPSEAPVNVVFGVGWGTVFWSWYSCSL